MILKVGLLFLRDGAMLLCRKQGTQEWILPGGKIDAGESDEECARRECREELRAEIAGLRPVGQYAGLTSAGRPIQIRLYQADLQREPEVSNEIEELCWYQGGEANLSPTLEKQILPDLRRRGLLS